MSRPDPPPPHRSRRPKLIAPILVILAIVFAAPAQGQRWASVSVGDDHVCALDMEGRAYCFGDNHAGQIGARTDIRCGIVSESGRRSCYPLPSDSTPLRVA